MANKAIDTDGLLSKPHLNVIFVGHVDAGKSTTCGQILYLSGQIDERTIQRYQRESKDNNREGWYLSYVFDLTEEERSKGKTVEVGRAAFELPKTRFTILDAPGHKSFVPNMIAGAAQADVGVLIISARKGEFEAGFNRSGQTREHALLCKTLGVQKIIVAVNKMDESSVNWDKSRYDEICKPIGDYLKGIGYPPSDVCYVPIAGLTAQNVREHVKDDLDLDLASWYNSDKPTLFGILDSIFPSLNTRKPDDPVRMPVLESYRDQGVMAVGKLESGTIRQGMAVEIVPGGYKATVEKIMLTSAIETEEEILVKALPPGENACLKLGGINEDAFSKGCVITEPGPRVRCVSKLRGQLMVVELLEHRPLLTPGYKAVFHAHTLVVEATVRKLVDTIDKKTKKKRKAPAFVREGQVATVDIEFEFAVPLTTYEQCSAMGRFTLRDETKTIAIGKILQLPNDKQ